MTQPGRESPRLRQDGADAGRHDQSWPGEGVGGAMAVGTRGVGAAGRGAWRLPTLLFLALLGACAEGDREAEALSGLWQSHSASLAALGPPGAPQMATLPAAAGAAPMSLRAAPRLSPPTAAPGPTPLTDIPLADIPLADIPRAGPPPAAASELVGAAPEAVLARLGPPALRRQEGDAQVWLYAGRACQLDLILYPTAGGPRVAHAAARAGGTAQRTEGACLRDLAGERPGPRRPFPPASFEPAAATLPQAS
jgi:hypothetical protein